MQNILFVLNDAPYGSEKLFNALRLAMNLNEQHSKTVQTNLFLMSDAVTAALPKQNPTEGYDIQQMLEILIAQGSQVKLCKTCTDGRGISDLPLIEGCKVSTLIELSSWTVEADKVLTF
ncbi:DsrE/DsrF/TusD sulfur relay family protein [Pelagibaculum spongiae]|uniref:Uncharacterized protein n=1 Tax=Pelagibaculum spongiae TaxID=2080658 RepID=A0A2V1GZM5_9GAMM|nr:DsrE family protein [Pelagibaculum spongiae]PVZ68771.1 hypothetical protein DC094_10970 [Pelagibaculum spongiae]